jgi:hypothetical protein
MWKRSLALCCVVALLPGLPAVVRGADQPGTGPRTPVARYVGESGAMLRRTTPTSPWLPVKKGDNLYPEDRLVGGLDAALESLDGAIGVTIRVDLAEQSPFPVRETALVLHPPKDVSLDFTLERGRVLVSNLKKEGPATGRIEIRDRSGEYTLKEPGAAFALEIYGRWPTGVPFKKDAPPEYGPPLALVVLALKGEVAIKGPRREGVLKAPPGIGMFITDSLDDPAPQPLFIDKLPAWANPGPPTERAKKFREVVLKIRSQILNRPVDEVLDEFVKSEDRAERAVAVLLMGALDDLERLGLALTSARHLDVWDAAVLALRDWIGRAPGQDMKLYNGLIAKRGFKPVQAEAILSMLHSFSEEERSIPETYEVLINYLENDKLAVRGLAYWHLIRLVPQGKKFGYDPTAPKEKRDEAVQKWRALIPTGKLPPPLKPEDIEPKPTDK